MVLHRAPRLVLSITSIESANTISKILFAMKALSTPATIPLSLATLTVVQAQVSQFSDSVLKLLQSNKSLTMQFESIKELYELDEIANQIVDGTEPFPDPNKTTSGISIEFKVCPSETHPSPSQRKLLNHPL